MPGERRTFDPRPPKPEVAPGRAETIRVGLLGGSRVTVGSRVIPENAWRLRKAAGLIKLLALAPGHRLHREQAMDRLWPCLGSRAAANNLHRALYSARQTLEPHVPAADSRHLRLRAEQLELCPGGSLWVDAEVFEQAAAKARRLRDPAAYRAAADLYAGELLPADRYEAWAEDRREGLRQQYLSLLLERAGLQSQRQALRRRPAAADRCHGKDLRLQEGELDGGRFLGARDAGENRPFEGCSAQSAGSLMFLLHHGGRRHGT